jgi:hypothetical protein
VLEITGDANGVISMSPAFTGAGGILDAETDTVPNPPTTTMQSTIVAAKAFFIPIFFMFEFSLKI